MIEQKIGLKTKQWMKEELKEIFSDIEDVFIVGLSGLKVTEQEEIRAKIRKENSKFIVVKNSTFECVLNELDKKEIINSIEGSTAIVLAKKDFININKILFDFIDQFPSFKIKSALLEKEVYSLEDLKELSSLPPREVLIAKVVTSFSGPLYNLVSVLDNQIKKFVFVLQQIKEKK